MDTLSKPPTAGKFIEMGTSRDSVAAWLPKAPNSFSTISRAFSETCTVLIEVTKRSVLMVGITAGLVGSLPGCTTTDIEVEYESIDLVTPIEADAARIRIGQFADQRDQKVYWIGEARGDYHYPVSILQTEQPVSKVVRDVIEQAAEDRGMLFERGEPPTYQLYGQILRLEGNASKPAVAHVDLAVRLFDLDKRKEVYTAEHKINRADAESSQSALKLGDFVETALNLAVAAALDDPELRAILISAGTEG